MRGKEILKIVLDGFIMFGCNVWMLEIVSANLQYYVRSLYICGLCGFTDYLVLAILVYPRFYYRIRKLKNSIIATTNCYRLRLSQKRLL